MIAVFTPTRRFGGLDVNRASLLQQAGGHEILWLIGDDLAGRRRLEGDVSDLVRVEQFDTARDGFSLCWAYNQALQKARDAGASMLISMQDYIWAPEDGVDRFVRLAERYPSSLLTGACSHSQDPYPREVKDPEGLETIFNEPYDGHQPQDIGWEDVRIGEGHRRYIHNGPYEEVDVGWWEANWAAIPERALYNLGLRFDEGYDRGIGHENQAFALKAASLGYGRVMDPANHAISLPHRDYFPQEWEELEQLRRENHRWHEQRRQAVLT